MADHTQFNPNQNDNGSYSSTPPEPPYRIDVAPARMSAYPSASASAAAAGSPKKHQGAKTFFTAFAGALVACVLALGVYTFAIGGDAHTAQVADISQDAANTTTTESGVTLGSQDPTVIQVNGQEATLAEAVAAKALPSVVAIYTYGPQQSYYGFHGSAAGQQSDELALTGMGSGIILSADGYVLTNYHVVENAQKLTVLVAGEEHDATYVGGDSSSDVAVVKVDGVDGLIAADIGDSDDLVVGEWVMTIGAPLGLEQSVATGVVSATARSTIMDNSSTDLYSYYYGMNTTPDYTYYPNMIQTDAVINPGNSGGALVDADGKVIGMNTLISSSSGNYAGVGFAIPINYALGIAQDVIDGKTPTHAILGVSISQVNSQVAARYNLSSTYGAYISAISDETGAAESDLQVGDIIIAIDGEKVSSTTDVTLDVRQHEPGDTVTVTVNRAGEELDIEVVLSSDELLQSQAQQPSAQQQQGPGQGGNQGTPEDLQQLLELLGMM